MASPATSSIYAPSSVGVSDSSGETRVGEVWLVSISVSRLAMLAAAAELAAPSYLYGRCPDDVTLSKRTYISGVGCATEMQGVRAEHPHPLRMLGAHAAHSLAPTSSGTHNAKALS